jgi:hypothetical protein
MSSVALDRSPEQKEQDNDHDQQAHTTAIVMVWRTKIETAPSKKEDENDQKYYQSPIVLLLALLSFCSQIAVRKETRLFTGPLLVTSAVGSSK